MEGTLCENPLRKSSQLKAHAIERYRRETGHARRVHSNRIPIRMASYVELESAGPEAPVFPHYVVLGHPEGRPVRLCKPPEPDTTGAPLFQRTNQRVPKT